MVVCLSSSNCFTPAPNQKGKNSNNITRTAREKTQRNFLYRLYRETIENVITLTVAVIIQGSLYRLYRVIPSLQSFTVIPSLQSYTVIPSLQSYTVSTEKL